MKVNYTRYQNIYQGYDKEIHDYKVVNSNGVTQKKCRGTLNLAKMSAESMANLIYGEKTEFVTENPTLKQLLDNNFKSQYRQFYEKVLATGQGIQLPFNTKTGGMSGFNRYFGDSIKETEFINGQLTKAVIDEYWRITIKYNPQENKTIVSYDKIEGIDYDEDVTIPESYEFIGTVGYHKPNIANNIDFTSKGIPIFANAIHTIAGADTIYHDYVMEFVLGRKRVYVSDKVLQTTTVDNDGNFQTKHPFDFDETVYQSFKGEDEKDFIMESKFDLRIEQYKQGIEDFVGIFSQQVGLGDYLRFDKTNSRVYKNETDVVSSQSDMFRNKVNHQNLDREELIKDIKAFMSVHDVVDFEDFEVNYDDSIISDDESRRKTAETEVKNGLRSIENYLTDIRKLDGEELTKELERIQQDMERTNVNLNDFEPSV